MNRWFVSSKQVIEAISRDKLVKRKEIEMSWPMIFDSQRRPLWIKWFTTTQRRSNIGWKSWRDVESVDGNLWQIYRNLTSFDFTMKLFPGPQNNSYWYRIISSLVDVADCLDLDQVKDFLWIFNVTWCNLKAISLTSPCVFRKISWRTAVWRNITDWVSMYSVWLEKEGYILLKVVCVASYSRERVFVLPTHETTSAECDSSNVEDGFVIIIIDTIIIEVCDYIEIFSKSCI